MDAEENIVWYDRIPVTWIIILTIAFFGAGLQDFYLTSLRRTLVH